MNTLQIYKAQPTVKDEPVEDLTIVMDKELPRIPEDIPVQEGQDSIETSRRLHRAQARQLCNALVMTLPGGTLDALLGELLQLKASVYRVRGPEAAKVTNNET